MKAKYVVTSRDEMVIFPESIEHIRFKMLNPRSAGYISICPQDVGLLRVECFGESISLGLRSRPKVDREIFRASLDVYKGYECLEDRTCSGQ